VSVSSSLLSLPRRYFRRVCGLVATALATGRVPPFAVPFLVRLVRFAWPPWLSDETWNAIGTERAASLLRSGPVGRQLITQRLDSITTLQDLISGADDDPTARLAVSLARGLQDVRMEDSRFLRDLLTAVPHGPQPLSEELALSLVPPLARFLSSDDARAIAEAILKRLDQPIDPYSPRSETLLLTVAFVALCSSHSSLDLNLLDRLRTSASGQLLSVAATTVLGRVSGKANLFCSILDLWQPSREELTRFAIACDLRFFPKPVLAPRPRAVWGRDRVSMPVTVASYVAGPLLFFLALLVSPWIPALSFGNLGAREVLAALSLLVAVQVVSTQLAANRLPGLLATHTSSPSSLRFGYSLVLALIVGSLLQSSTSSQPQAHAHIWSLKPMLTATSVVLICYFAAVLFVMRALMKRTDKANAAIAYAQARAGRCRNAGRKQAGIWRHVAESRVSAQKLPFLVVEPSLISTHSGTSITHPKQGIFLLNHRVLNRMIEDNRWEDMVAIVHIQDRLGQVLPMGEVVGLVVPRPDSILSRDMLRQASNLIDTASFRSLEEVEEAVRDLCNLLVAAAKESGPGSVSVSRISSALLHVLGEYVRAMQASPSLRRIPRSQQHPMDYALPVPPAVRSTLSLLWAAMVRADESGEAECLLGLLESIGRLQTRPDESILFAVAHAFRRSLDNQKLTRTFLTASFELMSMALAQDDRKTYRYIASAVGAMVENSTEGSYALQTGAELVVLGVWRNYFGSGWLWEWYKKLSEEGGSTVKDLGVMKVGAAALLAGNFSIAVDSVRWLVATSRDVDLMERLIRDRDFAQREQLRSELLGNLLGADAEYALAEYCSFWRRLESMSSVTTLAIVSPDPA
jgi:hypothetical protein